jgi:hypothetical protein
MYGCGPGFPVENARDLNKISKLLIAFSTDPSTALIEFYPQNFHKCPIK